MLVEMGKLVESGDAYRAAPGLDWLLSQHAMAEAPGHRAIGIANLVGGERAWHSALEMPDSSDGMFAKSLSQMTEVLRQHLSGGMCKPVSNQEGRVLRRSSVIEYEQEFAALLQALNRMRNAWGEYHRSPSPISSTKLRPS